MNNPILIYFTSLLVATLFFLEKATASSGDSSLACKSTSAYISVLPSLGDMSTVDRPVIPVEQAIPFKNLQFFSRGFYLVTHPDPYASCRILRTVVVDTFSRNMKVVENLVRWVGKHPYQLKRCSITIRWVANGKPEGDWIISAYYFPKRINKKIIPN